LTVDVPATAPANLTNTANVSGGGEINTANDSASDPTTIVPVPTSRSRSRTAENSVTRALHHCRAERRWRIEHPGFDEQRGQRAIDSGYVGLASNVDLATTIVFNETIVPQITSVKAAHITELRTAVNAVRAAAGLSPASFTDDPLPGVFVKAIHITELRTFLDAARAAIGVPLTYTDPSLGAGYVIKDAHIEDLRAGVR
jgi:hypothetical protein